MCNNWRGRITPENIISLKENDVILFGSNAKGYHVGGLAKICHDKFGAEWGIGYGPTGQCYAIDTMEGLDKIWRQIPAFIIEVTHERPNHIFYVTLIGCGIAGYKPEQISPMFKWAKNIKNVYLPKEFWNLFSLNH